MDDFDKDRADHEPEPGQRNLVRLRVLEFHEFEAIGFGGVKITDRDLRCRMWKGTHANLLEPAGIDNIALNRLIHHWLLPYPPVARVQSQIVMDQYKADAALPT